MADFGKISLVAVVLLVMLAFVTAGCARGAGDADAFGVTVAEEAAGVTRTLPSGPQYEGQSITVSLAVAVGSATYYGIDEVVPEGLTVTSASGGGDYTSEPGHVKWLVAMGAEDTTLTYTVKGPCDGGEYTFTGTYVMEGIPEAAIGGDSVVTVRDFDMLDAIADWKAGTLPMSDLLDLIAWWKSGSY